MAPPAPDQVPLRVVASGTALGLVLMSVFTVAWTANTFGGLPEALAWALAALALGAAACFLTRAARLLRVRRHLPADPSAQDEARRQRTGRSFGLVFGAEAVAIWVAAALLGATSHQDFVVPVVALVVGLHFYPMARIFGRRIDTYVATWTCLVAVAGALALATGSLDAPRVHALVGVGAAAATATYGVYMLRLSAPLMRRTG